MADSSPFLYEAGPRARLFLFLSAFAASAATSVEPGTLPPSWLTGGPNCLELPAWQVHAYNERLFILRQSGCTHYEKPFLYLFLGDERALLIDTGAGESDVAPVTYRLLEKWSVLHQRKIMPLVVAHSHGHGDHTAGDKGFAAMPEVTLVPATPEAEQQAFHITKWPEEAGSIDLGNRVIDVLAIPGHQAAHLAYYDRRTGILLTGDHLYAGRLYVTDFAAYLASTRRMVQFTEGKPVSHVLGCHVEQTSTPFVDYPTGTRYQPQEHSLELGRASLLELLRGLEQQSASEPKQAAYRDFTIVPRIRR